MSDPTTQGDGRPPGSPESGFGLAAGDEQVLANLGTDTHGPDPRKTHHRAKVRAALFGGPPPAPERIARYRILREIGTGAMGEVLEAYDDVLTRKVAVKLVHRLRRSPEASVRMLQEARSLAQLSHPNVVQVYEAGMQDERAWIAMEYIQGQNLTTWLEAGSRGAARVLEVFVDAGRGLAAAHEAGLVHRDFKPDNVLIDDRGCVKVVDFGLVRTLAEPQTLPLLEFDTQSGEDLGSSASRAPLTRDGTVLGTPGYMSPEQIRGVPVDARSDQFSFCASAWFGLFGVRPFRGSSLRHLHYAMHQGTIEGGTLQPRGVGAARRALLRGLSFDPEDRFPTMHALLEQLQRRPRRRWVLAAGATMFAGALAATEWGPNERPCGEDLALAERWSGERASAIQEAFVHTAASYAAPTAQRVTETMQAYATELQRARDTVCEAGRSADAVTVQAQLRCLAGRASALSALTTSFSTADVAAVQHAIDATLHLPKIDRCITLAADDEPQAPADLHLREALAQAHAARQTGHAAQALELSRELVRLAALEQDVATEVDGMMLSALSRFELGEHAVGVTELTTAIGRATAAQLDERTTVGWVDLATHGGRDLRAPQDTAIWLTQADAWVQRTGLTDQQFPLELARGHYQYLTKPSEAHATFDALVQMLEDRDDLDHLSAQARNGRAAAAIQLGRPEDAQRDCRWLLGHTQQNYGPGHPFTASAEYSLGLALFHSGDPEAIEHYERARATWTTLYPSGHPDTIKALIAVADLDLAEGRLEQAHAAADEALALQQRLGPDQVALAEVWTLLGVVQHSEGRFESAAESHTHAVDIYETKLGATDFRTGVARSNLGEALVMAGRWVKASPHLEAALVGIEQTVGAEHPTLAYPLKAAGIAAVLAGNPGEAIVQLERAQSLAAEADPVERAEIHLALGHALRQRGESDRAVATLAAVERWTATATELGQSRLQRLSRLLAAGAPAGVAPPAARP